MKDFGTAAIRNLALVGHGGTGKTSMADAILHLAKVTNRLGSVDEGTSLFDYDDEEKNRNISIRAAVGSFEWEKHKINMIDTPGYDDFVGDVVAAMEAVDTAVLFVDAQSGVEVGSNRAWGFAEARKLPTFICINKCDKEHSNFDSTYAEIQEIFGNGAVALSLPINQGAGFNSVIDLMNMKAIEYPADASGKGTVGEIPADILDLATAARERIVEQAAESDDELLDKYLEGNELTPDEIALGLKAGIEARTFFPVFATGSKGAYGLDIMLHAVVVSGPSPDFRGDVVSADGESKRKPNADEKFSALAFKTISEEHTGDLTFFRIFSGSIEAGTEVNNMRTGKGERIGQLYLTHGSKRVEAHKLVAGDIGAAVKLKETKAGDTLCESGGSFQLPPIPFPKPVIRSAIVPKTKGEEDKIGHGLTRLHDEDPTFHVEISTEVHQTLLHGLGELQLDIIVKRLKERFGVEVELIEPRIPYKETIRKKAEGQGKYKKQSGGRGQYGDVWVRLEPLPRGTGFEFASEVVGGAIPTKFLPAVEKGIVGCMEDGILSGCQVVDIKAVAYDGSYHNVDSSENAFKVAGSMAFRKIFMEANPVLLEPIMIVKVMVPEDCTGDVMGDFSSRRGKILGMEAEGQHQVVRAEVPLAELYKYSTHLRSITGGRGLHEREFSHYAEVPKESAAKVIAAAAKEREEES